MEKLIKSTSIISVILEFLYVVIGIAMVALTPVIFFGGMKFNGNEVMVGCVIAGVSVLIMSGLFLIMKIIMMILLCAQAKSESENIVIEVIIMVLLLLGLFGFVSSIISYVIQLYISSNGGGELMAVYSMAKSATSFVGFLSGISSSLMLVSATVSLCKKRWVNGLRVLVKGEVDL